MALKVPTKRPNKNDRGIRMQLYLKKDNRN